MKFTLSWLKEHLETQATLEDITSALTDLGLELEGITDPAALLGAFTTCRVIEAGPHPNADRLRLCRVETWPNGPDAAPSEVQVVCGAPNARTGLIGVFAPPGTHIPGTGVDLKPGVIRGVESNGMLCSERELMISDDHEGIIDLPPDTPLGRRYIDIAALNDPVIDIAITPNRPDALGVDGIARDLAARGLGTHITPRPVAVPGQFPCPIAVHIDAETRARGCPLFAGRLIRGLSNTKSPDWLQRRLRAIGLRPISALVDITNFMTFDRNRPLHVFDADKLVGDIRVHTAHGGETLIALDEKQYTLLPGMLAISDNDGVQSIAGLMGGLETGCHDQTVNVFVESAYWDPVTIARAGRQLRLHSDARYRFERGIDPAFTVPGLEMASQMILDLCGGTASEIVIAGAEPDEHRTISFDPASVESLVGMSIAPDEQIRILRDLGFVVTDSVQTMLAANLVAPAGDILTPNLEPGLQVGVPSWRPDIHGQADLVEEIARIASLSRLQSRPLPRKNTGVGRQTLSPTQKRARTVRRQMAMQGLHECVTYSFVSAQEAALFGGGSAALQLENPISSEMSDMRPDLLPGLLAAAVRNQAQGLDDFGLFELGPVFTGADPGEQTEQAAAIMVGATGPRHWAGERRNLDALDARAGAEGVLGALGMPVDKLMLTRDAPDWFHPGRAGLLRLGPKNILAAFGELHPKISTAMRLRGPVVAYTIMLENIPQPKARGTARPALSLARLQPVMRDFAFVVDHATEARVLLDAVYATDKKLITNVQVFDVFAGKKAETQFGPGKKSLAISVTIQPHKTTLTDAEIDTLSARIIEKVETVTKGTLRA